MSITYTPTTNFGAKDSLPANDPAKVIKGAEFTTEYTAIQSAFALAAPAASPTFTGTASFADVNITNDLTVDTDTLVVDSTSNKVGIGTASPSSILDVAGSDTVGITYTGSTNGYIRADASTGQAGFSLSVGGVQKATMTYDDTDELKVTSSTATRFITGVTERVRIAADGNVGIGTDSPFGPLDVKAATDVHIGIDDQGSDALLYTATDAAATAVVPLKFQANSFKFSGSSEFMRIDSSGNVGIGTDSPVRKLTVFDAADSRMEIRTGTNTNLTALDFSDSDNTARGKVVYDHSDDSLSLETLSTERMRIDSSGKVGIGTDSPQFLLDLAAVDSGVQLKMGRTNTNIGSTWMGSDNTGFVLGVGTYAGAGGTVADPNGIKIDTSGNVGIGEASPTAERLCLTGASSNTSGIRMRRTDVGTGTGSDAFINISDSGELSIYRGSEGGAGTTRHIRLNAAATDGAIVFNTSGVTGEDMRLDSNGNLLVGTSTGIPNVATKVQVEAAANGQAGIGMRHSGSTAGKFMRMWTSNVNALYIQNNGNTGVVLADGATTWTATSDETLKENISDIGPVLDTIKDYQCVNYSLKATESEAADKVGFIAQDWENDFPSVVNKSEDGTLSMKYTETIPVLLKAIQEQQAMIEALKVEVEALKNA